MSTVAQLRPKTELTDVDAARAQTGVAKASTLHAAKSVLCDLDVVIAAVASVATLPLLADDVRADFSRLASALKSASNSCSAALQRGQQ